MKAASLTQLRRHASRRALFLYASCLMLMLTFGGTTRAQDNQDAPQTAPPPMKFVSRAERDQLAAARDAKARTRLSLDLTEAHLRRAEEHSAARQYDEAAIELGNYQGIIGDALSFLKSTNRDSGKTRDLYRKIELALRAYVPRIEAIRRTTPFEYAVNVKEVGKFTRDARAQALEAFYGDTVLREDQSMRSQASPRETAQEPSTEKKEP
jgi:hypothetical protein